MNPLLRPLLYPAPGVAVPSPPPAPLAEVALAAGGQPVSAWSFPGPGPQAPVALYLHGNGENLETMRFAGLFERLRAAGTGVLAIDYPGYGRSGGTPSEGSLVAAAEAGLAHLVAAHPGRRRVIVGWSLGAAVAAQVAARRPAEVDALVLWSAWDRLEEVARRIFPAWLVGMALDEHYDSAAAAADLRLPTLMAHGAADGIIAVERGRALAAAFPVPPRFLEVAGAGHNDLLGREAVWLQLATFFAALS